MAEKQHPFGVSKSLYRSPALAAPSKEQVAELARDLKFKIEEDELQEYADILAELTANYSALDDFAEPLLPVKYPRTPGYRPAPENNPYNAWYWCTDIRGADDGLLAGKTVGIKDNVAVAGVPMMNGSRMLEGYVPEFDATIVTRILDAGGRILGKTSVEDHCFSGSSFTNGKAPVLNPHDNTRSAGGSSGGSAALVAAGIIDMAIGGDQGGSIRLPSCWCGVVGLKPTHGLVPYTGASSIHPSYDHLGPIARTVYDCALMLEAIAGRDGDLDHRQPSDLKVPKYTSMLTGQASGIKIGVVKEGFEKAEPGVEQTIKAGLEMMKGAGAEVEEFSLPLHRTGACIAGIPMWEGSYDTMIRGNACGMGWKGFYPTSLQVATARGREANPDDIPFAMKIVSMIGEYSKRKTHGKFYSKAVNLSRVLRQAYDDALDKYDVLVMPTIVTTATKLLEADKKDSPRAYFDRAYGMLANTPQFDVTGHPALSINAGFVEGLPVGMMIIGKHFDDATVLRVAHAFEQLRDKK